MTALTYQKDARAYRFSLPNEIWGAEASASRLQYPRLPLLSQQPP